MKISAVSRASSVCWLCFAATAPLLAADPLRVDSVHITLAQQVDVPAPKQGLLEQVVALEGQAFESGNLLARVDDDEAKLVLDRAKLELAIARDQAKNNFDLKTAEAKHRVAERNLERAKQSTAKFEGSISAADLDKYQLDADSARYSVSKAKAELALAKLNVAVRENEVQVAAEALGRHQLLAPFRGIVVDVKKQPGEWVQPGDAVLRIIRIDRLRAEGFVSAAEAASITAGMPTTLSLQSSANRKSYRGKVVFVSPEVDPVNRQVRIYAEIVNVDLSLKPGLKADMTIERDR